MRLTHVALWTTRLEELRAFYTTYFGGTSGEKYTNPAKGFESYFIRFGTTGVALEIMRSQSVTEPAERLCTRWCHVAFDAQTRRGVEELTERLRADGYRILSEPRQTGDGFYESVAADPDGNPVEIVAE
ncbi:MAG: VOC family protein [Rikenella sp.]|nr:VOC family protein [Rikenella sp.]